ncbi:hypothetical protein H2203_004940 [Taxawa tesnikishii (nom. ined.)]|nr:hypothetical protein H2203_004940 [Dothideales sp. JES 119]
MGVRDTDDYITARGANPHTGLISPSIYSGTPRTPSTPGEALRLYSESPLDSLPGVLSSKNSPQKRYRIPLQASRWCHNDKGWFMETLAVTASPHITVTDTATGKSSFVAHNDRFVMPMPSARKPQPYTVQEHTAAQVKAFEHYEEKAKRLSRLVEEQSPISRTHSVGAGPRKFAEASKALRACSGNDRSTPQKLTVKQCPDPEPLLSVPLPLGLGDQFTAPQHVAVVNFAAYTTPGVSRKNSSDSVMDTMKTMPGGFEMTATTMQSTTSTMTIMRKPIGSPPRPSTRRDSEASIAATATWAEEKEVCTASDADDDRITPNSRSRSNSNSTRFQDLRRLPRVCLLHPDFAAGAPYENVRPAESKGRRVFTLPDDTPTELPPPRRSLCQGVHHSEPEQKPQDMALYAHTLTAVFLLARVPFRWTRSVCTMPSMGAALGAIEILAKPEAKFHDRIVALKTLVLAGLKAGLIVFAMVVVWRIGTAVKGVMDVALWPLGVVMWILRWVFGPL